jgi:hypothetical protein
MAKNASIALNGHALMDAASPMLRPSKSNAPHLSLGAALEFGGISLTSSNRRHMSPSQLIKSSPASVAIMPAISRGRKGCPATSTKSTSYRNASIARFSRIRSVLAIKRAKDLSKGAMPRSRSWAACGSLSAVACQGRTTRKRQSKLDVEGNDSTLEGRLVREPRLVLRSASYQKSNCDVTHDK